MDITTCQENRDMNEFKNYHPIVNFAYFTAVIGFAMFLTNPICLCISFLSGFTYSVMLNGKKAVKFNFTILMPMMIITALVNPVFNHEGITILAYLPGDNPLTLESVFFGIASAAMLATVVCYFSCYNKIMTSDKFIYLFGRVIPSMSLILSMTLRIIPRFRDQMKTISHAQRCIGCDISQGSILKKAKNGMRILSVMVTWALEHSIETADSMRSRGYGLPGRSAFSIFTFNRRDLKALLCIIILSGYVIVGGICGGIYFRYFPSVKSAEASVFSVSIFAVYFILCMIPVVIELWEVRRWKFIE